MNKVLTKWALTPIAQFLSPISRPVSVAPLQTYDLLGMHWYAEGLYIKERKPGNQIQATTLYQVQEGDFVYNRLFAWKGSFGIAGPDVADCYVSNEFPCFRVDESQVCPAFLLWYFSQARIWEQIEQSSSGSTPTSRLRLKEDQLLSMQVPLPPLDEQRRIVAHIDDLAVKIEEARGLYKGVQEDSRKLLLGAYAEIVNEALPMSMKDVAPLVRRPINIKPEEEYYELGIRSFGKGTFHKPPISGIALGTKRIFQIMPGDLLFNIVFAWEGAVAVAKPKDMGRVGSHRFLTCLPKDGLATSTFLCFHFLTEQGLQHLGEASPGGAGRNRTLGLKALEEIIVPVPPLKKQIWFDGLQSRVDTIKHLKEEAAAELDALLPSILDKAFRGEL